MKTKLMSDSKLWVVNCVLFQLTILLSCFVARAFRKTARLPRLTATKKISMVKCASGLGLSVRLLVSTSVGRNPKEPGLY